MGAIDDIYEDLDAEVSREDFGEAVDEKVDQMGGLADEETAAMLVAHELSEGQIEGVADVEPGMEEAEFTAKVTHVGELRTFERDGEDEEGRVINVDVADETGAIRASFWDHAAQAVADGEIEEGDVLKIKGRPKEGFSGVEVSVGNAEIDEETEIEVNLQDTYTVEDLSLGLSDVDLVGVVLDTDSIRTFDRDDGSEGRVANLTLGDETGRVRVTLWDERADLANELDPGTTVEVVDGYVKERDGQLELHVGNRGAVEPVDADVEYVPEATDIADVEIGETVDLAGVVRSADPKRTFDRDDGSEGQVKNVRIQDETGDIRVALWGEKADKELGPGDRVQFADVEIQDGWQDDLEASAGWRSTVTVLAESDGSGVGPSAEAQASRDPADTGLEAFSGEDGDAVEAPTTGDATESAADSKSTGATGSTGSTEATEATESTESTESDGSDRPTGEALAATTPNGDDAGAEAEPEAAAGGSNILEREGETIEFTGTVVQSGDPVILDNGEETMTVSTDATVTLGQQVTARGPLEDGTLHAEEVF